jgi:ABC-2 type transport system ATP-binding protein
MALIDGHDCTRQSMLVKRITGYMPDNIGFYSDMTGRENLRFMARLNGIPEHEINPLIDGLLEKVGMTHAADQKTETYSKGMRQRLGIADVLIKDPEVIIMDEPTTGLDPEGMREFLSLIKQLSVEDKKTILVSSHQLYQI